MTRVLAAMSGGVDSSVAAALLVERGLEVVGVTMKLLPRGETGFGCCGSPADVDDARRVCERLGARHYVADLSEAFEASVVRPFVDAYLSARTPNPCVECNRKIKFGRLLALARAWGCAKVATGHYARAEGGRLLKSRDERKDQTYFLYSLTPRELAMVEFPVGALTKDEVRARARELGLATADKPESQETCFVPGRDVRGFVASRSADPSREPALAGGPVRDLSGRELGTHSGLASYTVGQRRGLGAAGGEPRYVVRLSPEDNALVVGGAGDVFSPSCVVEGASWTGPAPRGALRAQVRVRHRHAPADAEISPRPDGTLLVRFDRPQRAVAPGQAAVFYDGDAVLGGGTIARGDPS